MIELFGLDFVVGQQVARRIRAGLAG